MREMFKLVISEISPWLIGAVLGLAIGSVLNRIDFRPLPEAPPCVIRVFSEGCFV